MCLLHRLERSIFLGVSSTRHALLLPGVGWYNADVWSVKRSLVLSHARWHGTVVLSPAPRHGMLAPLLRPICLPACWGPDESAGTPCPDGKHPSEEQHVKRRGQRRVIRRAEEGYRLGQTGFEPYKHTGVGPVGKDVWPAAVTFYVLAGRCIMMRTQQRFRVWAKRRQWPL